ncbi:hypothetical protein BDP55DRAFT_145922 [Colletotrichum godetiae]|uniref:Uncharacterized protein n=1 Tax=Colletotrichum godetiae TaxID=1209918 RepID=A0AAJ0EU10_9PEZI|nr:uncharacterized protein BDP55DRAFT_145922 [Colletotrichum godetiae]KAK1675637.1 hypothetical protein BDP55DRAFT_145922 [Colletotrichum godetiae]
MCTPLSTCLTSFSSSAIDTRKLQHPTTGSRAFSLSLVTALPLILIIIKQTQLGLTGSDRGKREPQKHAPRYLLRGFQGVVRGIPYPQHRHVFLHFSINFPIPRDGRRPDGTLLKKGGIENKKEQNRPQGENRLSGEITRDSGPARVYRPRPLLLSQKTPSTNRGRARARSAVTPNKTITTRRTAVFAPATSQYREAVRGMLERIARKRPLYSVQHGLAQ